MTPEQFERFLEALIDNRGNGERLASIESLVKAGNETAERFRLTVAQDISDAKKVGDAAHRRIDKLLIIGGISVLVTVAGLVIAVVAKASTGGV